MGSPLNGAMNEVGETIIIGLNVQVHAWLGPMTNLGPLNRGSRRLPPAVPARFRGWNCSHSKDCLRHCGSNGPRAKKPRPSRRPRNKPIPSPVWPSHLDGAMQRAYPQQCPLPRLLSSAFPLGGASTVFPGSVEVRSVRGDVFRTDPDPDYSGRNPAQHGETIEQPEHERHRELAAAAA